MSATVKHAATAIALTLLWIWATCYVGHILPDDRNPWWGFPFMMSCLAGEIGLLILTFLIPFKDRRDDR